MDVINDDEKAELRDIITSHMINYGVRVSKNIREFAGVTDETMEECVRIYHNRQFNSGSVSIPFN